MNPRHSPLDASSGRTGRGRRSAGPIRAAIATALIAATIGLAGCTPGPAPKPTPTPLFTSEADAFRAAEQVVRDYVRAENELQGGDKGANPEQFLTGEALSEDIKSKRESTATGTRILGVSEIASFTGKVVEAGFSAVRASTCLDVSNTKIVDGNGNDITPTSRPTVVSLEVKLIPEGRALKIVAMTGGADPCD